MLVDDKTKDKYRIGKKNGAKFSETQQRNQD